LIVIGWNTEADAVMLALWPAADPATEQRATAPASRLIRKRCMSMVKQFSL
jgi:hypothetical protein